MEPVTFYPQVYRARKSTFVRFPKSAKYSDAQEKKSETLQLHTINTISHLERDSLHRHLYLRHVWRLNNPYRRRIVPVLLESYPKEIYYQIPLLDEHECISHTNNKEIQSINNYTGIHCTTNTNKNKNVNINMNTNIWQRKQQVRRITPILIGKVSPSSIHACQQMNAHFNRQKMKEQKICHKISSEFQQKQKPELSTKYIRYDTTDKNTRAKSTIIKSNPNSNEGSWTRSSLNPLPPFLWMVNHQTNDWNQSSFSTLVGSVDCKKPLEMKNFMSHDKENSRNMNIKRVSVKKKEAEEFMDCKTETTILTNEISLLKIESARYRGTSSNL